MPFGWEGESFSSENISETGGSDVIVDSKASKPEPEAYSAIENDVETEETVEGIPEEISVVHEHEPATETEIRDGPSGLVRAASSDIVTHSSSVAGHDGLSDQDDNVIVTTKRPYEPKYTDQGNSC